MKSSKFATALRTCIATLLLTFASGAWAEPEMQAIYCRGNTTLYFIYGEPVSPNSSFKNQAADYVFGNADQDFFYAVWSNISDITSNCEKVVFEGSFSSARPSTCANWFLNLYSLTEIEGIENLNTSEVTSMYCMFANCRELTSLDLSRFNTSKVANMGLMFLGCLKLTSLDLTFFDTSKVTNMADMFNGCSALTTLTVGSSWNTGIVETSSGSRENMFTGVPEKTILPLCLFDDEATGGRLENSLKLAGEKNKTFNIVLCGRKLYKDGDWNTICLPFNVTSLEESPLKGATLKELDALQSSLTEGKLKLTFKNATSIEAGKPYLIKWANDGSTIESPVFNGVTIKSDTPSPVDFNSGSFVGQYDTFSITESNMNTIVMLGSNNYIGYSNAERTLRPMRAHFEIPTITMGAPAMTNFEIDFDGAATGITAPISLEKATGRRAKFGNEGQGESQERSLYPYLPKGIYIINGKKVLKP